MARGFSGFSGVNLTGATKKVRPYLLELAQQARQDEADYSEGMFDPAIDAGENIVSAPESTQSQDYLDYSQGMFTPDPGITGVLANRDDAANVAADTPMSTLPSPVASPDADPMSVNYYLGYAQLMAGKSPEEQAAAFAQAQEDQNAAYGELLIDAAFNDIMSNGVDREQWNTYSGDVREGFEERYYEHLDNFDRWGYLHNTTFISQEKFNEYNVNNADPEEGIYGAWFEERRNVRNPSAAHWEFGDPDHPNNTYSYHYVEGGERHQYQQNLKNWGAPKHEQSWGGFHQASSNLTNMESLINADEAAIMDVQTGDIEAQLPQDSRGMIQQTVDDQSSRLSRNSGFRGSVYTGESGLTEMAAKKPWKRLGGAG